MLFQLGRDLIMDKEINSKKTEQTSFPFNKFLSQFITKFKNYIQKNCTPIAAALLLPFLSNLTIPTGHYL